MAQEGFKRKLAAILSADVEGYSRLMDDDEEATVRTITSYRTAIADLVQQFRGRKMGMIRTLSPEQEKELRNAIKDKCPDQLKLQFALWTRGAVQQLIFQLWSIQMPIRTVGEYLSRWNFTPQKSLRKANEQNPKAVRTS